VIDLQSAKDREIEVPAANESKRHGAVEGARAGQRRDRATTSIRERGMSHPDNK
jgi:hypothetical protein